MDLLLEGDFDHEDFNDDMLGRNLDAILVYGTTKLFSEIAFEICLENNLLKGSYHLDSTSVALYGEYEGVKPSVWVIVVKPDWPPISAKSKEKSSEALSF